MIISARRDIPGLATLYLGRLSEEPLREVEFVDTLEPGVPKEEKWVMMISTQLGCAVGCAMCDAGAMGYGGNLSAAEMLAQVDHVAAGSPGLDLARHPKVKVHFARMGEPSLNPAVLEALRLLSERRLPGLLPSLSTVAPKSPAVRPFFDELRRIKEESFSGGRFQLQFSLHSTDEKTRRELIPVRKWELYEIAEYGAGFVRPGDRKITLNFATPDGGGIDPGVLSRVFDPAKFLIKVTPVNPTRSAGGSGFPKPWSSAPARLRWTAFRLRRAGFQVILSPSMPEEIEGETSCGQLWSAAMKERASVALRNKEREVRSYAAAGMAALARRWAGELGRRERRGFSLRPGRAGLLVVDMQNFFLSPDSPAYLPPGRAALDNVRRLVSAFRAAGRPVFFSRHAHLDPAVDGGLMLRWWDKACLEGTPESRVAAVLEARPEETFRKCRYSAFSNPELEPALRRAGVEDLVVAGVMTNLCVESTCRDAFERGWPVFAAADAAAAKTEELHLASLRSLAQGFAGVRFTDELEAALAA